MNTIAGSVYGSIMSRTDRESPIQKFTSFNPLSFRRSWAMPANFSSISQVETCSKFSAKKIVEEVKQIVKERNQKRLSIPTEDFIYSVRPIFEQQRQLIYLIGQIETPKIHLYNDIHQIVKADYIKRMSEETSQALGELDFQGHLFATISLDMMKYKVCQNILLVS